MEVLQIAMVWMCLIADPSVCETRQSDPFFAEFAGADQTVCKRNIVDLIVQENKIIDPGKVIVSSGCQLAPDVPQPVPEQDIRG